MKQFGAMSALAALAFGVMFAVNAYFLFATSVSGWLYAATALALVAGGFRTLRKMSGGLRLLAAAWGFAAGLLSLDLNAASSTGWFGVALFAVAISGAVLTVLHKEK